MGVQIGSDHMKVKLRLQKWRRAVISGMRQQIRIGRLKEDRVRREYQEAIREKLRM